MTLVSHQSILLAAVLAAFVSGCSAPAEDDDASSESAQALSTSRLERSRIEVSGKNTTSNGLGECLVSRTVFRITYENETLPAGTKVALHVGQSLWNQDYIGDGFGWSDARKAHWQGARDVEMTQSGAGYRTDVEIEASGRSVRDWSQGYEQWTFRSELPEIQFVFRIELPNGRVLWDNRLRQDYGVAANGANCPGSGFFPITSWGPF
jgi:hypothetical protein